MAGSSPTIVAASLSDADLKASITKLVDEVERASKRMGDTFTSQVERMRKSLLELGNTKVTIGSSVDGGSSQRTRRVREETAEVEKNTRARKENVATLDQQAQAIQRATSSGKKETGYLSITSDVDKSLSYIVNLSRDVDAQLAEILRKEQALIFAKQQEEQKTRALEEAQRRLVGVSGASLRYGSVESMQLASNRYALMHRFDGENINRQVQGYSKLEQAVAQLIGVKVEEINLTTSTQSAYTALSSSLSQMTKAYREMSKSERDSAQGNELADKIQRTQRAIQEIQKQMTRPVSLESIIKFNPKTLDEMAYKMQQLSSYRSGLDVNTRKNEIRQVNAEYERLKKRMDEVMQKNQSMIASNTALGRSWNYMKNRLAFYFTVGASTAFVKNLIDIRSQYELNERALGILINSAERGTQIFNELSQMALVSPYTLIELSSAAKQLVAYDVAAKDVVETTRRLADMASAVGVPMERLTYALGQIKAYGYLNSRDNRMFANAGIPLVRQLSDYYTELEGKLVSTADVYDRIKKKAVDYNDVMQVINRMTDQGGRFFDFQAKMADTLKVRLANLTLAWNNMLNEIGKETQGVLTYGIGALRELFLRWKEIDKLIKDAAIAFGISRLALLARVALTNFSMLGRTMTWNIIIGRRLTNVITQLLGSMKQLATSPVAWITLWISAMASAVTTIDEANQAVRALNKSIQDSSKENFDNIQKFLDQYKKLRDSLYSEVDAQTYNPSTGAVNKFKYTTYNDISEAEANKAWTAIREQIELTSASSEYFVGKLLEIDDVNARVRTGFEYLEEIRDTYGALQGLEEDAVYVQQDFSKWWNLGLGSDSLVENIKDYTTALKVANGETGGFAATVERIAYLIADTYRIPSKLLGLGGLRDTIGALFPEAIGDVETSLNRIRQNMTETSESIINALSGKNLSTDQWREAYELMTRKAVAEANLSQEEQLAYRIQMEKNFIAVRKRMFDEDREYIKQQDGNLTKEEIENRLKLVDQTENEWLQSFGEGRTLTQAFYDYLKQQHRSEIDRMFGYLSDKELDTLDKSVPNWREWAMKNAQEFAKANRLSFEELWSMINDTNKMRIFIKTTIGAKDEDSEYDILTKADNDLADANKRRERLLARRRQIDKEGAKSDEELVKIQNELTAAEKDYNDALERGGVLKEKKGKGGSKKDVLGDALSKEIQLVGEVQKRYNEYRKIGVDANTALSLSADEFSRSLEKNNAALAKFGITGISAGKLATMSMREVRDYYSGLLETATKLGNTKGIEALEKAIANLNVEITKIDYKRITDGLNNELAKLKDEYELALEIDADPELGNAFANMMGIDPESLPHTVKEYADRYSTYLNKYLKGKDSSLQFTGDELRGLTRDDITAFREQVDAGSFNQEWFDAILKAYEDISGKRKKDLEETEKWKNSLIEKYGNLQDKLTKIYKDSVQNQVNAVKTFGTEDQKSEIVRLQLRLEATDDPAELADINLQIAEIVKDVTDKNPIALKLVTASDNQTKADTSKAYWEDFKNSELYAMTFEDMANNSTQAIQLIMDKLEGLKDKVKEDPASMKALIKSLEDAQKELNARDPFGGVARSLRDMANASQEAKTAQEALWQAEVDVEQAQQEVDNSEDGTPEEQAAAQQKLADAVQRRATAQVKLTQAENKGKKAQENLKSSLQGISNQLGDVKELFGIVSKIFRAGGDDETADAIDAISEGFSIMTTVIMGVVAAMIILQSTTPWLLAIAAALSVIVGLVSFLSGNSNKKITEQVEESERAVKRLELAYIDLEHAVQQAYGMATIGANMAAKANKELQLVELKRQLALERSRDSKHRDEDRIIDLQKQIKELEYEIADTVDSIVNDLLGISSVGDAMENMMDAFVEALRSGEDAMATFDESVDEMIANMVKKMYVTKILQPWFEEQWNKIQSQLTERAGDIPDKLAKIQSKTSIAKSADTTDNNSLVEALRALGMPDDQIDRLNWYNEFGQYDRGLGSNARLKAAYEKMLKEAEQKEIEIQKELTTATMPTTDDIRQYAELLRSGQPIMEENMQEVANFLRELGLMKDDASKNLSNLQQGISQISETTANALEAYMNSVNQQVYYHSSLLEQIRDSVVGLDLDVSLGFQSEMLLQLQNSYQTQQAIRQILEGVLVPSGRAFAVELIS